MSESMCDKYAETGDPQLSPSKASPFACSTELADSPEDRVPSPKQLMCSQNRAEIQAIQTELSRVGILSETRNNPTAEALGITGLELWVKDEQDFVEASNLCANVQARLRGSRSTCTAAPGSEAKEFRSAVDAPPVSTDAGEPRKLEQDTAFIEKQLDEMLDFQREVVTQCICVRGKMKELGQVIGDRQAAITRENEMRAAAQKKQEEELSALQNAIQRERLEREQAEVELKCERAKREAAEEKLEILKREWQEKSAIDEEGLIKAQEKLYVQAQLIQTHTAAVLRFTKEAADLKVQRQEDHKLISKLREDLVAERKVRVAAEQRLGSAPPGPSSISLPSLLFRRPAKTAQSVS